MKLKKVSISNFKSIQDIDFNIKKYGSSYTTMLLGVNESGKSNILEAMSFLSRPRDDFYYLSYHNQKDDYNKDIDIHFDLSFEDKETCLNAVREKINNGGENLNFEIYEVRKTVYLKEDETVFREMYTYNVKNLTAGLFIKTANKRVLENGQQVEREIIELSKNNEIESLDVLTTENFDSYFGYIIANTVRRHQPRVTVWKPSKEYLISNEDLIEFSANDFSKSSLKNIFILAGYKSDKEIRTAIANVENGQQRSKLQSKLEASINDYIKQVWKHHIDVVIDITETGMLTLSIKDSGEKNKHDRLPIDGRSEGARHFLSLILSLSIESTNEQRKNQLILIDEPEAHLHPSGIRDLRKELLNIGFHNYLFVSTHSPFLVDRKNKDRNIIIKKNYSALTEKINISKDTNVVDDEVLREAFGIEVYKDLLNPHSILVEGSSDKYIIQKMLNTKKRYGYGITNGHGSNIDTLASKLNDVDISVLVVVDDDKDGRNYKEKIINIGGSYSSKNVFTLKDLVSEIPESGTIEDLLGKDYVESMLKTFYKEYYNNECDITLLDDQPLIVQIKTYLYQAKNSDIDIFIEMLKEKLASDLVIPKTTYNRKFPLLNTLIDSMEKKLP